MRLGWLRASLRRALALVLAAGMLLASGVGLWGAWRARRPLAGALLAHARRPARWLALAAALLYAQWATHPAMAGALRGMGAVASGLIGGMALKLAAALRTHVLAPWVCGALALATFVAVVWWHIPLYGVLLVLGGMACILTWRRLAP